MASAAERVFAILELADKILLEQTTLDLFVLQRVSRTFHHNITSTQLLGRKCFLLDAADEDTWFLDEPYGTPDLEYALPDFQHLLEMYTFKCLSMISRMPTSPGRSTEKARPYAGLYFTCTVASEPNQRRMMPHPQLGFCGLRKLHDTKQSWERMRLNRWESALRIIVAVRVWSKGTFMGEYTDQRDFCEGRWTLGDLFDAFSSILERSMPDHISRLHKWQPTVRWSVHPDTKSAEHFAKYRAPRVFAQKAPIRPDDRPVATKSVSSSDVQEPVKQRNSAYSAERDSPFEVAHQSRPTWAEIVKGVVRR